MDDDTDFPITSSLLNKEDDVESLSPKRNRRFIGTRQIVYGSVVGVFAVVLIIVILKTTPHHKMVVDWDASAPPRPGGVSNYLFELIGDPTENINLYNNANYIKIAGDSKKNATKWMAAFRKPQVPDNEGQMEAFGAAGGIVPWRPSNETSRNISQLYSYSGAPHIVFFFVDDWGFNDAGFQSTYLNWTTPNIDLLMRSGVRLTNYYTHETCVPSRAALMTGRYAGRFGMHEGSDEIQELPTSEVTLAEELKSAGYATYLIGKWHLGTSMWPLTPTYRGFDYFYGYYSGFIDYWTKTASNGFLDLTEMTTLVQDPAATDSGLFSAYLYQQKAEAIIKQHAQSLPNTPMFLYYASQLVHNPVEAPPKYVDLCQDGSASPEEATYCAMNLVLDEVVGALTCSLKENGLYDNTLFVLASDNGGANPMKGSNAPWKGGKGSTFRGGSSANAFVYGSDNLIPAGRRGTEYEGLMHVTDWLPTLMGVATNGEWAGSLLDKVLDGVDQFPALRGDEEPSRHEILHFMMEQGNLSYQYDNYKGIIQTSKTGGYQVPAHYFSGNGSAAIEKCLVDV